MAEDSEDSIDRTEITIGGKPVAPEVQKRVSEAIKKTLDEELGKELENVVGGQDDLLAPLFRNACFGKFGSSCG